MYAYYNVQEVSILLYYVPSYFSKSILNALGKHLNPNTKIAIFQATNTITSTIAQIFT